MSFPPISPAGVSVDLNMIDARRACGKFANANSYSGFMIMYGVTDLWTTSSVVGSMPIWATSITVLPERRLAFPKLCC